MTPLLLVSAAATRLRRGDTMTEFRGGEILSSQLVSPARRRRGGSVTTIGAWLLRNRALGALSF